MDRRDFLRASLPPLVVGLAGCSGNGGDGNTPTASPTATPTSSPAPTDSPTPADSPEPTDSPAPTDEPTPTDSPTATESPTATDSPTPSPTATPVPDVTVAVGPDNSVRFEPQTFEISTGDTVLWEWESGGHNVSPDDDGQPSGADWAGDDGPEGEVQTFGSGHTYVHTFDVAGEYSYHCDPHQSIGMTGSFTVK